MKILQIFPFYGADLLGGAEVYQHHLAQELAACGAAVEVLTTCTKMPRHTSAFTSHWPTEYPPGETRDGAVSVHRFPVSGSVPALIGHAASRQILRRWRQEDARAGDAASGVDFFHRQAMERPGWVDAIVGVGRGPHSRGLLAEAWRRSATADVLLAGFIPFGTVWYGAQIAARRKLPFVLLPFFHPEDRYHHFRLFYRCLAAADAVLAQSPYSAALFERLAGARAIQIGVGVDRATATDPSIDGRRFRAEHGLEGARIALFVGRKEPTKRYDIAIDAVESLRDERLVLVMIGGDIDGRPLSSPRVRHLGRVSRATLLDAYDACDVFVLPSTHESFGIVFLEAWMRGKPVLGNRLCGPVASVIADGVDGFLCADVAEFAARMRQLIDEPDAAAAMGRAGQAKALERYTWDRIGLRVYELCEDLSASRARTPR
jgi:glycosyltransferase involved in cell wall biosynthesis